MDPSLLATASTTTVTVQTIAAAATSTAAAAVTRSAQRNGTHRAVNVHGRLMYDEIVINDVWINAILSTLALTCAACVCLCFLYCKFQQWKQSVQQRRNEKNSRKRDDESLPSYTIVTGLPSYDEAIERMKQPAASSSKSAASSSSSSSSSGSRSAAKQPSVSVVHVKDEVTPAKPDTRFGLVSHSMYAHDSGCSHCLSVQELLETYNVR